MTSDGSPYARFRRALTTGNLHLVRAAAHELPYVALDDALQIALLMAHSQDPQYEPAAIRWLARLCLERPAVGFDELAQLLAALEALPTHPAEAWTAVRAVCARHRIPAPARLVEPSRP